MRTAVALAIAVLLAACSETAGPGLIVEASCIPTYTRTVVYDSGTTVETTDYAAIAEIDASFEAFPIVQALLCSRETFDSYCPTDADCAGEAQDPACELVTSVPFLDYTMVEIPCGQVVDTTLAGSPLVRRSGYRWRGVRVTMRD
jgi:hypothetical protein